MKNSNSDNKGIERPNILDYNESLIYKMKRMMGLGMWEKNRVIFQNGITYPTEFHKNIVKNTKYNIITFIPLVLFNQFKFFLNIFTALLSITQLFQALRVGFVITYIGPLIFILSVSISKEAFDDLKRYCRDREINQSKYRVLQPDGTFNDVESSNLKVGDIIEITVGKRIPADLILLYTSEKSGSVFIKTDQLDGETDWKLRKAVHITQEYKSQDKSRNLRDLDTWLIAEPPSKNIYSFEGTLYYQSKGVKEGIGLENTMWANTILTIGTSLCQIVYTGKETRCQMNTRSPRTKQGVFDTEANFIIFVVFLLMFFLALILVALNRFHQWYIMLIRFIVLLSCIIPISLRVNFDIAKVYYSYLISNDKEIEGTIARNSTIPEELGRIQYLFSDKTGTLTQNVMEFKTLFTTGYFPKEEVFLQRQAIIENSKYRPPLSDIEDEMKASPEMAKQKINKTIRRTPNAMMMDLISCLALCHNVTPIFTENGKDYQASSPDEIALVKFSDEFGINLKSRTQSEIILFVNGKDYQFEILAEFPFTSASKRMGIILKDVENQRIFFMLKGAEVEIRKKVKSDIQFIVDETCSELAKNGLRTLVFCEKLLKTEQYDAWKKEYEEAKTELGGMREKRIREVIEKLEDKMEFLGVTGVEDKLQNNVNKVITKLKEAGIKIWMLTGDKAETAKCISISSGLKKSTERFEEFLDMPDDKNTLENGLNKIKSGGMNNKIFLIDGTTFSYVVSHCESLFFQVSSTANGVVVCRCSPTQKTIVVNRMKHYTGKRCAGIGDGGNDVGMIQEADCGIGIKGKEGLQASLSADFSIETFENVLKLILYHGQLSYKRSTSLTHFIVHRGTIITIIQFIFCVVFYYSPIPVYNSYLLLGYATFYTFWPVLCFLFDEHLNSQDALAYPRFYEEFTQGKELGTKRFIQWTLLSLYQGSVIMYGSLYLIDNSYLKMITISFTTLIFTEMANIWAELEKCFFKTFLFLFCSMIFYALSMILMKSYFDLNLFELAVIGKILIIFFITFLPPYLFKKILRKLYPPPTDIVKSSKKKNTQIEYELANKDDLLTKLKPSINAE